MTTVRTRGFSFVELVVATLIMAIALIPFHYVFIRGQKSVIQSKFAYMAMHVARELAQDLRAVPFDRLAELDNWERGAQRVQGPLFKRVAQYRSSSPETAAALEGDAPSYPADYTRILYRIRVKPVQGFADRLRQVDLEVVWEEKGIVDREAKKLYRYSTIVGRHSVDPEVTP